ncbi:MAG: DUF371 domain-containing protein [Conexivisphaerales archaeon]
MKGRLLDTVNFTGHSNVRATNNSTIEVTTEDYLTLRGDCIIGILADKSCSNLSDEAKLWLERDDSKVIIRIKVLEKEFEFIAMGSSKLSHTSNVSMVIRKSSFISERTLAVKAGAAAKDIPREMIAYLQKGEKGRLEIYSYHL